MVISVSFSVSGLEEIKSNLDRISEAVTTFQQTEPMTVANNMVLQMQDAAPVDTGYLRDHITAEDGETEGQAVITSEADYSIYVEFGTRYMAAEPFFFPVFDQLKPSDILNDFKEAVGL